MRLLWDFNVKHAILFKIYSSQWRASFKAQNIAVHDRVYTVRMSKAMAVKISSFNWFSVYLRYNAIGVIYMYIYDKVFDMEM